MFDANVTVHHDRGQQALVIDTPIDGLHRRHVGGKKKKKLCSQSLHKMAGNSQRRKISLLLSTNMTAMTSHVSTNYAMI